MPVPIDSLPKSGQKQPARDFLASINYDLDSLKEKDVTLIYLWEGTVFEKILAVVVGISRACLHLIKLAAWLTVFAIGCLAAWGLFQQGLLAWAALLYLVLRHLKTSHVPFVRLAFLVSVFCAVFGLWLVLPVAIPLLQERAWFDVAQYPEFFKLLQRHDPSGIGYLLGGIAGGAATEVMAAFLEKLLQSAGASRQNLLKDL